MHVASGARLLTKDRMQLRVSNDVHVANGGQAGGGPEAAKCVQQCTRGCRLLIAVELQSRMCNAKSEICACRQRFQAADLAVAAAECV